MITIGIDPHKSSLTAVAVDATGEPAATAPADTPAVTMTISDRFCGGSHRLLSGGDCEGGRVRRVVGMSGFTVEAVTVRRGGAVLLDGITAEIGAGVCTAGVGASGAGKSTLLRVLNRLEEPDSGRVCWDGIPLSEMDVLVLRRRVGLVAQHPVLLAERVGDDLRVGRPQLSGQVVVELLGRVGLSGVFAERRCAELSGGEAQRVCLARALAVVPRVLLLDEPTSALDGVSASLVEDVVQGLVAEGGTVVLVSHDMALVGRVAQQVMWLDAGRLITSGYASESGFLEAR